MQNNPNQQPVTGVSVDTYSGNGVDHGSGQQVTKEQAEKVLRMAIAAGPNGLVEFESNDKDLAMRIIGGIDTPAARRIYANMKGNLNYQDTFFYKAVAKTRSNINLQTVAKIAIPTVLVLAGLKMAAKKWNFSVPLLHQKNLLDNNGKVLPIKKTA